MKTVIMAGGKGTRISSIASDIPKPMIKIDGKPVLEREIECLRDRGYTDIVITVGHLGDAIIDWFGDGRKLGVDITYYSEKEPLGNAGALFEIKDMLTEDFLLLNGDLLFDIDFDRFVAFHRAHGGLATLFTHPNSHPYDSSLIMAADDGRVVKWLSKEDERPLYYRNRVNAGLHVLSPKVFSGRERVGKVDLDRDILRPLAGTGKMFAYDSPEYVKDMGTPERYAAVCADLEAGIVGGKNLRCKQKAIFLDRDGTINEYVGFLRSADEFRLASGAAEAIKKINDSGRLAIVITNQPVLARGEVTREGLSEIHDKMETLLGRSGAWLDGIYYCPHHPDKGFEGEVAELKTDCGCRKPKPGLILQAAADFNIDLASSWMVGDSETDVACGINAGCMTAVIGHDARADIEGKDLADCINKILGEES